MSVYAIHKLLWLSEDDPEFRSRIQALPAHPEVSSSR